MPIPQGPYQDASPAQVRYGGSVMHSQEQARALGHNDSMLPAHPTQEWAELVGHNRRMWSPGLGAQASATSYGWPYEDITLVLVPPPVPLHQMMVRGSLASLARPGGGQGDFGYSGHIPATPVPINYSRPGY